MLVLKRLGSQNLNSLASLALQIFNALIGIIVMICLGQYLTIEAFGSFYFVLSIVLILAVPTTMGLPILVTRETAIAVKDEDGARVPAIMKAAVIMVLITAIPIVVLGIIFLSLSETYADQINAFYFGFALIVVTALSKLRAATLRGLGYTIKSLLPDMLVRPLLFLGFLLFAMSGLQGEQNAAFAMMLQFAATAGAFVVGYVMLRRVMPTSMEGPKSPVNVRHFAIAALTLGASNGLVSLNNNIDSAMLGMLATQTEVGIYRPASSISNLVLFGFQAATWAIMSQIATAYRRDDKDEMEKMAIRAARFGLTFALIMTILIVTAGKPFLTRYFGVDFADSYLPLVILTVGQLANASFGALTLLLNMTGNERVTLIAVGVAVLVNITLNAIFVPIYGVPAAAIVTIVALLVNKFILLYFVKKRLSIKCAAFVL